MPAIDTDWPTVSACPAAVIVTTPVPLALAYGAGFVLAATVRLWNSTQHYRRAFMLLADPGRATIVNAGDLLITDGPAPREGWWEPSPACA